RATLPHSAVRMESRGWPGARVQAPCAPGAPAHAGLFRRSRSTAMPCARNRRTRTDFPLYAARSRARRPLARGLPARTRRLRRSDHVEIALDEDQLAVAVRLLRLAGAFTCLGRAFADGDAFAIRFTPLVETVENAPLVVDGRIARVQVLRPFALADAARAET